MTDEQKQKHLDRAAVLLKAARHEAYEANADIDVIDAHERISQVCGAVKELFAIVSDSDIDWWRTKKETKP